MKLQENKKPTELNLGQQTWKQIQDVATGEKKAKNLLLNSPEIQWQEISDQIRSARDLVRKFSKKERFNTNIANSRKSFLNYLSKNRNDLQFIVERRHTPWKDIKVQRYGLHNFCPNVKCQWVHGCIYNTNRRHIRYI